MLPMSICVSGWYFEPGILKTLSEVQEKYPVVFITKVNRWTGKSNDPDYPGVEKETKPLLEKYKLKQILYPLRGLEFAAYDHYIKNVWDSESNILFIHDDIRVADHSFFDEMAALQIDQGFIFENEFEGGANQHFHGRGIFQSKRFTEVQLKYRCDCNQSRDREDEHHGCGLLRGTGTHSGFWHDPYNDGEHVRGRPPMHVRHYNDEIYHYALFCKRLRSGGLASPYKGLKMISDEKVYNSKFVHARRGVYREDTKRS